jgi:DNA-binding transcriptional LysR family regulator
MSKPMNLQRLRYFEAVGRHRSFRRAAEELNISQPALSRQIQVLEDEVGVDLLLRSKRRVALTPGGAHLWRRCSELLDEAAVLTKEVRQVSKVEPIPFTIGVLQSLVGSVFPQAYMALREEAGKVPLCVCGFRTTHIITGVLNGDHDVGVVSGPVTDKRLLLKSMFEDIHVAVLPKGHRLEAPVISLQSLADPSHPMVGWPVGYGIRDTNDQVFAAAHHPIRSYAAEVESLGAILELVRAGLGTTVVPLSAVTPAPDGVAVCRIEDDPIVRAVISIQRVGSKLPPFSRRLIELMTAKAQEGRRKFDRASRR